MTIATVKKEYATADTTIKMKELFLSHQVLNDILLNGLTTKKAIRNVFLKYPKDKSNASLVGVLVGCELRHHILFSENFVDVFAGLSDEEKNLVYLALANAFFLKKLDKKDVEKHVKDVLKDKYSSRIEELLHYEGHTSELINIDKTSGKYTSIRFNTPEWLIKMWKKHYGNRVAYKILKANITPARTYVAKNTYFDEVVLTSDFKKTYIDGVFEYTAKSSIRKLPLYQSQSGLGAIYRINPLLKQVIDKYQNPLLSEWTLFSDEDDDIVKYLYVKSNQKIGINLIVNDTEKRADLLRLMRIEKMKNILMFKGDNPIALKTGLTHKQEFILANPASSSFNRIRLYPDYIFNFKRENIDALIKNQEECLENLSQFVINGGVLIYTVDTLNKKETVGVISNFLEKHDDYELVEQAQHFPFEDIGVTFYYAVLKKKESSND